MTKNGKGIGIPLCPDGKNEEDNLMNGLFSIDSPLWSFSSKALNFLWLSMLWLVCSLPVITIGASTAALYSVTLKYAREEEGYLTSSFFAAFRQNFRQGTAIWLILLLAGLFLGFDFAVYYRSGETGPGHMVLMTLCCSLALVFVLTNLYVYAILARFQNSVFHIIKNACIMAICHWPSSLTMLTLSLLILAVGFVAFPPLLFFAPAGLSYLHARFLRRIFDQYAAA